MFQKILASIGVGAAKVDTVLQQEHCYAGDPVRGAVRIEGGAVEQQIDSIYLVLSMLYTKEADDRKVKVQYDLDRFQLTEPILISPGEKREVPFSFLLPLETPVTFGSRSVWVSTGLDIKNSIDPTDRDYLEVLPSPLLGKVLESVQSLGFRLRQAECEELPHRLRQHVPFAQEFEFVPTSGPFHRKLDELELLVLPVAKDELEIVMEIDRKARGLAGLLSEAMDLDETRVRFRVVPQDLPQFAGKLEQMIFRYC
ncbi:sporulation protein [Ectobacillus ponti]|uniref:Sporulation protein n=1 Tax=Ectobacillus ponti TaxID=2961894 RepID=A0AA41XBK9_9BACI|nr:sporulation protein [Ectobacillus ponti]MCP8970339.1 sporulation protein [Ectobacillus ponti]